MYTIKTVEGHNAPAEDETMTGDELIELGNSLLANSTPDDVAADILAGKLEEAAAALRAMAAKKNQIKEMPMTPEMMEHRLAARRMMVMEEIDWRIWEYQKMQITCTEEEFRKGAEVALAKYDEAVLNGLEYGRIEPWKLLKLDAGDLSKLFVDRAMGFTIAGRWYEDQISKPAAKMKRQ